MRAFGQEMVFGSRLEPAGGRVSADNRVIVVYGIS